MDIVDPFSEFVSISRFVNKNKHQAIMIASNILYIALLIKQDIYHTIHSLPKSTLSVKENVE